MYIIELRTLIRLVVWHVRTSLVAHMVKHLPTMRETWVQSLGRKISWRRKRQPIPVLLPGKSYGKRSLVGYHPGSHKESDTTEPLHFHFSLSCTGEGNGNPLQCSCLENPRDGGAWWAAISGVAQSRTGLKRLSSSSSSSSNLLLLCFLSLIASPPRLWCTLLAG